MNCIDFRRHIFTDPGHSGEAGRAHALECAACRKFLEQQRDFDAALFAAFQVPAPDGLADRILVARGSSRRRWILPVAAAVLLTPGLVALWPRFRAADPLGLEAITHVAQEPRAFTTFHSVSGSFFPALLSEQGMEAIRAVGQVTYVRVCPMAGQLARHLVLRTSDGPATIFLLPDYLDVHRQSVTQDDGMAAIAIPAARGTLAIVAASLDHALALTKSFRPS
jgi:hypothetical protein